MNTVKLEKEARVIYESLKMLRGAFKEGAPTQINEYYQLFVDPNFKAIHIAHKSAIVISIDHKAISIRVEQECIKEFDGMKFLQEFIEALDEKHDQLLDAKLDFDKKLLERLKAQVKKMEEEMAKK